MKESGAIRDPWFKASYRLESSGRTLHFDVPHDVFSTLRIDEGTLLFLDHLPESKPQRILDLGCGYGALGLPVAAAHPQAEVLMVDRDLLAVEWARRNAIRNQLSNAKVCGSLGYQSISGNKFDWILCNMPARIGKPFMEHFFKEGLQMLEEGGEIRTVVIKDLIPVLEEISRESGLAIEPVSIGIRHGVYSLKKESVRTAVGQESSEQLYLRDSVIIEALSFERPCDLGGDDPKRLAASLPLLLDTFPRQKAPRSYLSIRSGYGILPILAKHRWPDCEVSTFERDLLALDYIERNSKRLLGGPMVHPIEGFFFPECMDREERFDLITIELSSSAGEKVAVAEIEAMAAQLSEGGLGLVVALDKIAREWLQPRLRNSAFPLRALAARNGFTVFSVEKSG